MWPQLHTVHAYIIQTDKDAGCFFRHLYHEGGKVEFLFWDLWGGGGVVKAKIK